MTNAITTAIASEQPGGVAVVGHSGELEIMGQAQPIPPVNVRLVFYNREVPVECVFVGLDDDGTRKWVAVAPVDAGDATSAHLLIDDLPAETSVEIAMTRRVER